MNKILNDETSDGRKYQVVFVEERYFMEYACWDPKLLYGIEKGDMIKFEYTPSGNLKKLVVGEKIDDVPESDEAEPGD